MRVRFSLLAVVLLCASLFAHAQSYDYTFSFTNLASGSTTYPGFTLTIPESGLIGTTGLQSLSTPLSTPFGYTINYFGENSSGLFLFSNDDSIATITDSTISFSPDSFSFFPNNAYSTYLSPGDYLGTAGGNGDPNVSLTAGDVSLSIAAVSGTGPTGPGPSATPEPSTFALLGTGLLGFGGIVRRRIHA